LLWTLGGGLLALLVVIGVWIIPGLAAPLTTAAAVVGGAKAAVTTYRGIQQSVNSRVHEDEASPSLLDGGTATRKSEAAGL
jgi:hypothetical protein